MVKRDNKENSDNSEHILQIQYGGTFIFLFNIL